jgi:hypothetical protein
MCSCSHLEWAANLLPPELDGAWRSRYFASQVKSTAENIEISSIYMGTKAATGASLAAALSRCDLAVRLWEVSALFLRQAELLRASPSAVAAALVLLPRRTAVSASSSVAECELSPPLDFLGLPLPLPVDEAEPFLDAGLEL